MANNHRAGPPATNEPKTETEMSTQTEPNLMNVPTTETVKQMKTHWTADMYPLNEEDVARLADDIKANGQIAPIKILADGRIIDGRNRWLACQRAGVEPITEIVNPNGEDFTDEQAFTLATSCNSMRRDMTSSLRACLAAESWKRLYPEGNAPGQGRKKKGEELTQKVGSFKDFAKDSFKVNSLYAEQALAIANHSLELLEDAKDDLAGAYKTYQGRAAEDRVKRRNVKMLEAPESSDIRERVANNTLAMEEAITLLRKRNEEEIKRIEAEAASRNIGRNQFKNIANFLVFFRDSKIETLVDLMTPRKGEEQITDMNYRPFTREEAMEAAELLTQTANAIAATE